MADFVKTKNPNLTKEFSKNTFIGSRRTGMSIVKPRSEAIISRGKLLQFKLIKK